MPKTISKSSPTCANKDSPSAKHSFQHTKMGSDRSKGAYIQHLVNLARSNDESVKHLNISSSSSDFIRQYILKEELAVPKKATRAKRKKSGDSEELEAEAAATAPSKKRSTRSARASTAKRARINSIPDTLEDAVEEPGPNDVAIGRGSKANNHIGNKRFQAMAKKLKLEYLHLQKEAKTDFSKRLVQMVHDECGQFLAKDEGTGLWYPVDFKQARTKASQALREENRAEREAKKKYLS